MQFPFASVHVIADSGAASMRYTFYTLSPFRSATALDLLYRNQTKNGWLQNENVKFNIEKCMEFLSAQQYRHSIKMKMKMKTTFADADLFYTYIQ